MKREFPGTALALTLLLVVGLSGNWGSDLLAKEKAPVVNANDPTYRIFQLLDSTRGGKLKDFYLLGDIYQDPKDPGRQLQRVLRIEYDKSRYFGRFRIYVRSVGKLTPEQLKTYTIEQIYDFGGSDAEKFEKIEAGPFGMTGDLYLRAEGDRPLASAPTTDEVRSEYNMLVAQYILPALEKK
jgi:hypothetical protein